MWNKIWDWLIWSSADPKKLSLTLKGFVPFALSLLVFLNWDLTQGDFDQAIEGLVMVVSGVALLYGFGRKVFLTAVKKGNGA